MTELYFTSSRLKKIQKEAFKTDKKSDKILTITLNLIDFTADIFEPGTFDGIQRPTKIRIYNVNLGHLDQSVFRSFFNENKQNKIILENGPYDGAYIDCEDCRNQWLSKDNLQDHVYAYCKQNNEKSLFAQDIQSKLNAKCK